MAILLNYPLFQAFDSNGDPLVGGLLYTYVAGTTTAKATYTTRAMTTANANPVVLDSRGEAVIYGAGLYKLILKTSAGTTIWTQDNVEMGPGQGANAFWVDPSETDQGATGNGASLKDILTALGTSEKATVYLHHNGASNTTTYTVSTTYDASTYTNVTFDIENGALLAPDTSVTLTLPSPSSIIAAPNQQIFSGAGSVAYSKGGDIYFEWYGATGDGATDDSTALQAAINASGTYGCIIHGGSKTYSYATTLAWKTNAKLYGTGRGRAAALPPTTILSYTGAGHAIDFDYDSNGSAVVRWAEIRDVSVTAVDGATALLYLNGAWNNVFESCSLIKAGTTNPNLLVEAATSKAVYYNDFRNVWMTGGSYVADIDGDNDVSDARFNDNTFYRCNLQSGANGMRITGTSSTALISCNLEGNTGYGLIVHTAVGTKTAIRVDVIGCYAENTGGNLDTSDASVNGVRIFGGRGWPLTETQANSGPFINYTSVLYNVGAAATDSLIESGVKGEAADRFQIQSSGLMYWGNGTDAVDTNLKRVAADHLGTTDTFSAGDNITQLNAAGYIQGTEIADPAAPGANLGRLYFRDNGAAKTQLVVRFPTGAVQVIATEP